MRQVSGGCRREELSYLSRSLEQPVLGRGICLRIRWTVVFECLQALKRYLSWKAIKFCHQEERSFANPFEDSLEGMGITVYVG